MDSKAETDGNIEQQKPSKSPRNSDCTTTTTTASDECTCRPAVFWTIIIAVIIYFCLTLLVVLSRTGTLMAMFVIKEGPCDNTTTTDYTSKQHTLPPPTSRHVAHDLKKPDLYKELHSMHMELHSMNTELHTMDTELHRPKHYRYLRFSQLLLCLLSILHWFEYSYLFYGTACFLATTHKLKKENPYKYTYNPFLMLCWTKSKTNHCITLKKILKARINPVLYAIFFIALLVISLAPPAINLYAANNWSKYDKCLSLYLYANHTHIDNTYYSLTLFAHANSVFVRFMFVIAVATCGSIWLKQNRSKDFGCCSRECCSRGEGNGTQTGGCLESFCKSLRGYSSLTQGNNGQCCFDCCCCCGRTGEVADKGEKGTTKAMDKEEEEMVKATDKGGDVHVQQHGNINADMVAASVRYNHIMDDYKERVEYVQPIYKIFRSWFVFQWVYYVLKFSHDLVYLLRPWLRDETSPISGYKLFIAGDSLICLYDIFMILVSYLPALKMNAYLQRYIRDKQNEQLEQAKETESEAQKAYAQTHFSIQMIPKSDFRPGIPGFGANISIKGPGFIVGTVFLIIGTVATFSIGFYD